MPEHHPATRCMRAKSPYTIRLDKKKRDVHNNKFVLANDEGKIHRIFLKDETEVEFLNLVSPSCIWVRLTKNVAENMDLRAPYPMKQALQFEGGIALHNSIKEYGYYMAPRILSQIADDDSDNFAYSRARVLQIKILDKEIYCYVFYIDYAYGNWVKADSLGIMPRKMKTMPWQAIPVALMGVSPAKNFDITKDKYKWTQKQCQILRNIMKKYKRFDAKPFTCKLLNILDYEHYARVELVALIDKDAEFEEEIDENDVIPQINDDEISDENERVNSVPKQKPKVLFKPVKVSVTYEFYSESRLQGEPIVINAHYDELTKQKLFDVENKEADADSEIPAFDPSLSMSKRYCEFPDENSLSKTDEDVAAEKSAELKRRVERQEAENRAKGNIEEEQRLKEETKLEKRNAFREWDIAFYEYCDTLPEYAQPLTPQISKLETSLKKDDQFCVILNSTSLNSPYDFYGHLLKSSTSVRDCQKAMIEFHEELEEWQAKLNNFYLVSSNCKKFNFNEIQTELVSGRNVYAIICKIDHLEQTNFVRVKIVNYVDMNKLGDNITFCDVRLLDHGGTETVNIETLLRIHSAHTSVPPFSIQMCLSNIVPERPISEWQGKLLNPNDPWDSDQQDYFQLLAKSDIPMCCNLVEIWSQPVSDILNVKPIHLADQTHFVRDLRIVGRKMGLSIEDQMIEKRAAKKGNCPRN